LIIRAKVICQDQKDFSKEIKNIKIIWCLMNTHKK
jgi:hypothetical protein